MLIQSRLGNEFVSHHNFHKIREIDTEKDKFLLSMAKITQGREKNNWFYMKAFFCGVESLPFVSFFVKKKKK